MESRDRWLYGWGVAYTAVGAASLLVPLYALALGGGPALVGLLAAAAAFAGVPGALLWSRLAARTHRRRPFLLVSVGMAVLVLIVAPLAVQPWLLVLVNAGLWFAVAAATPVLNLVMVDGIPESEWERRFGLLNTYQGYGWVAGLALGTVWTVLVSPVVGELGSLRLLFVALAVVAAVGFGLIYRHYPDPVRLSEAYFRRVYSKLERVGWGASRTLRTVPLGPSRIYWGLATVRPERLRRLRSRVGRYLAASTLFSVGFGVFWGPMPAYLVSTGVGDGTTFLLFLVGNVGSAVTYGRVAGIAARTGPAPAQVAALGARVVLFPAVIAVGSVAAGAVVLAACFALIGITWAVIAVTSASLVTRLTPVTERGDVFGLQAALVGVGTGIGSVAGGLLATQVGYFLTFTTAAAAVLFGSILVVTLGSDSDSVESGRPDSRTR